MNKKKTIAAKEAHSAVTAFPFMLLRRKSNLVHRFLSLTYPFIFPSAGQ